MARPHLLLILIVPLACGLAACQSLPRNEGDPVRVTDVVERIKADLAAYLRYDAQAAQAPPLDTACRGIVGFDIESVKVSLTTQTDATSSVTGGATLAVGSGSLGATFGVSEERKGTQSLGFTLYPARDVGAHLAPEPEPLDPDLYPITTSLKQLREDLLAASAKTPCMALTPPDRDGKPQRDEGGSFSFGFTVNNQVARGGGLKFVVFALGPAQSLQHQVGNTITVTFRARAGSAALIRPGP